MSIICRQISCARHRFGDVSLSYTAKTMPRRTCRSRQLWSSRDTAACSGNGTFVIARSRSRAAIKLPRRPAGCRSGGSLKNGISRRSLRSRQAPRNPDRVIPQISLQSMLNDPTGLRRSDELQSRALATPHGTQLLIQIRVMIEVKVQKTPAWQAAVPEEVATGNPRRNPAAGDDFPCPY